MNCIENIIGIKANCDGADTESLSGYFITDYPGITLQSAANYNDEKTVTGFEYLKDLRRRAMLRLSNDILSYIANNYRVNSIPSNLWRSGEYSNTIVPAGNPSQRRGMVIYKQNPQCRFLKIEIKMIRIYVPNDVNTILRIADTVGTVYNINVALTGGVVNEFLINKMFQGNELQITLPSDVVVYTNRPFCGKGCMGSEPNSCVKVNGLDNVTTNTTQTYGIDVDLLCRCDLSSMICDLATQNLIGQAAYELCGAMFYDEMIKNHRMNYLTIYKGDEISQQSLAGFDMYRGYLENAMKGLRNYLVQNDGGCKCVDCSGINFKTNV